MIGTINSAAGRSGIDGGKSWEKTHDDYLDNVYNSYGYYFGQIRVAGYDANKIYITTSSSTNNVKMSLLKLILQHENT